MILFWKIVVLICFINSNRGLEIIKKNVRDLMSCSCWIEYMELIY